ncbi:MAG: hypothetical protein JWR33_266 [Naasia sp.]|jgi:hypothetical protein|uniref:DUF2530 domain-containing protein n=1 Tax=Naasia sp. TaxID=2546198 RepID=UPI00262441AA|nr:DUF2530 domain-containing protein [Naasia sp.]MCU1569525.1 hypothetical protein [Naasia sp.]
MRFYLRDSERRPDPDPVRTDDRKAVLAGLIVWVAGLLIALLVAAVQGGGVETGVVWLCTAGIALGLGFLVYTERRRRRSGRG